VALVRTRETREQEVGTLSGSPGWYARAMPESDDRFVLLGRAPAPEMAALWASLLEAAGILSLVPGTYLADEWAATQRVTGNVGADVYVPLSRLDEARRVIEHDPPPADFEQQALEAESPETEPPD
jgi:hypothetical protein